jgi:hypothetical protein
MPRRKSRRVYPKSPIPRWKRTTEHAKRLERVGPDGMNRRMGDELLEVLEDIRLLQRRQKEAGR